MKKKYDNPCKIFHQDVPWSSKGFSLVAVGQINLTTCLVSDSKGTEMATFKNWEGSQEFVFLASHERWENPTPLLSDSTWQQLAGTE